MFAYNEKAQSCIILPATTIGASAGVWRVGLAALIWVLGVYMFVRWGGGGAGSAHVLDSHRGSKKGRAGFYGWLE